MSVNSKMTAIADEIRELSGTSGAMGLDDMASTLNAENTNFISNLSAQDSLIAQIITTVNGLPEAGSGEPNLQTKTITPSTSTQTVKPDSGYDGLSQVTVNGDSNLVAGNIAEGVSIFGITGTHSGSSGGGSVETCIVTLSGKIPIFGDTEKVFYTNGSSSIQEVGFPNYNERTSITIIKNSIIFVYGVETKMIGNAIALNTSPGIRAYFISGDTTIFSA